MYCPTFFIPLTRTELVLHVMLCCIHVVSSAHTNIEKKPRTLHLDERMLLSLNLLSFCSYWFQVVHGEGNI